MRILPYVAASFSAPDFAGPLGLRMVPQWGAIVGQTYEIWLKGLGYLTDTSGYTLESQGPGASNGLRWTWTPTVDDIGTHTHTLRVRQNGVVIGRRTSNVRVMAASGYTGTVHIVCGPGDSITETSGTGAWRHVVKSILETCGYTVVLHGRNTTNGVNHDGYAGRTAEWHNRGTADLPDGPAGGPWKNGGPAHLAAYGGGAPAYDFVVIQLGTNDWPAQRGPVPGPEFPEDFATVLQDFVELVDKITPVANNVIVGPTFPFGNGTLGSYTHARAETNRRIGNGLLFDTFSAPSYAEQGVRMGGNTHCCLDSASDFPEGDGFHPTVPNGHAKIAAVIAGQILLTIVTAPVS